MRLENSLLSEYRIYEQTGRLQLEKSGVVVDPLMLPISEDTRRGLGLFFFHEAIRNRSQPVLRAIAEQFPEETLVYDYDGSPARQHVTFLGLVGTEHLEDFTTEVETLIPEYRRVLDPIIGTMRPVKAYFRGIAVNPTTIIIKGYPDSPEFNHVRDEIIAKLTEEGLPRPHRRSLLFHTTIARFIKPVSDIRRLLELSRTFSRYNFGEDTFSELHLSIASWVMAEEQVRTVTKYELQ